MVAVTKTLLLSLAVVSLALVTRAEAQDKCGAAKMRAVGKKAGGEAKCYAKALTQGDLSTLQACLDGVGLKFVTIFQKVEAKGPCLTNGDAPDIEAVIDACAGEIFTALRNNCGDGVVQPNEQCDDGDIMSGDGCSALCLTEHGFTCTGEPSVCATTCGDGLVGGAETCDEGNTTAGDGCSATCSVETGYSCCGEPSACIVSVCGDGIITCGETCDDANTTDGDGCSAMCAVEHGYGCVGQPSVCGTTCGDGLIGGSEGCDDGNNTDGDGMCQVEGGFTCAGEPSVCTPV